MKRLLSLSLLLICICMAHAQNDVLYMNNGSILKGTVLEMTPSQSIKFKTNDGSIFVFDMDQVTKLEKIATTAVDGIPTARLDSRTIAYKDGELYWSDHSFNTPEEMEVILGKELYQTTTSASHQVKIGNRFMFAGVLCAAGVLYTVATAYGNTINSSSYDPYRVQGLLTVSQILAVPADAFICLGCVFRGVGNGRLKWVRQTYNRLPIQKSSKFSLNPSMTLSPLNDLAFGGTLSISF